ncbi:aminotransferase class V-fold PLP-dependent enzyme [Pelagerythrobacter marensis]|uniref:Isopenicillin N epimerase n=1 Tax=Pelagerythrobacter marensis TaxID=543877 RepID=A0A0G3X8U8_9SPHN|nr:aminotransferase class V-fold PLP-dependent enzyme [Pelagerythrobacter marensis]AKM08005.1 Isopenicillin N epimerase [Pelagerythrobacter marensis]
MPASLSRRTVLAGAAAGLAAQALPLRATFATTPGDDEAYWARIAAQYDGTDEVIQLENGNWGMMARPVLEAYQGHVARVNRDTSYYARRGMGADLARVRDEVADFLKVDVEEIVFTRNATEALKTLIGGYNRIGPGEAALFTDLDYDSMQDGMVSAMARRGAEVIRIALPEPASYENVLDTYRRAFDAHPHLRLVLLTHVSHRTGLQIPVREIVAMARERGIDAIVDAAHSLGQVDFTLPDLNADFVGLNLHKWIGAPLGVGAAYIRRDRIAAIDPDMADANRQSGDIRSRVHTGTVDFAALLSVPDALGFQASITAPRRAARLRALRDRWVEAVKTNDAIQVLTPNDPRMYAGITSFRLRGLTSFADNRALAERLLERHGIFTVLRTGLASGSCIRITPALFNSMADMDSLARALGEIAERHA